MALLLFVSVLGDAWLLGIVLLLGASPFQVFLCIRGGLSLSLASLLDRVRGGKVAFGSGVCDMFTLQQDAIV